jgi:histidyl-tRNA synthetase
MKFKAPKGTRDFLPQEMIIREYIIQKIKQVFESYGFEPLESPAFEDLKALEAKCGTDIKEQIFKFEDKAGRRLGLKFDLTVPLARIVANNPQLPKPFKAYQISKVWRYEEITKARKREFWQADIDVIGSKEMEAEVECMACAVDCLKALGLKDFVIRINNRKVLNGFIELIKKKVPEEMKIEFGSLEVFRAIDKLEKIGVDGVREELKKIGLLEKQIKDLLRIITIKGKFKKVLEKGKKLLEKIPEGMEGIKELEQIYELSKFYNITDLLLLDFSLARGLDYYTGPIFEIIEKTNRLGSLAGGGRYDNLIEILGGRPTPATGISLGVERIAEIIKEKKILDLPKTKVKVFVANVNTKMKKEAVKIAQKLREKGISCQTDLMNRSLTKQLEFADSLGIPYTIIVGEKEWKKGKLKLKDMKKKTEKTLKIEEIFKIVKGN